RAGGIGSGIATPVGGHVFANLGKWRGSGRRDVADVEDHVALSGGNDGELRLTFIHVERDWEYAGEDRRDGLVRAVDPAIGSGRACCRNGDIEFLGHLGEAASAFDLFVDSGGEVVERGLALLYDQRCSNLVANLLERAGRL